MLMIKIQEVNRDRIVIIQIEINSTRNLADIVTSAGTRSFCIAHTKLHFYPNIFCKVNMNLYPKHMQINPDIQAMFKEAHR
jgi:hypothetical protein